MKNNYKASENIMFDCRYNIVFCPKYKRRLFDEAMRHRIEEIFKDVSEEYNFEILKSEIGEDFCYIMISCNPAFGVMECLKKLKMSSASILKKEFPSLMKRVPNIWTRNALITTNTKFSHKDVDMYLESQKNI